MGDEVRADDNVMEIETDKTTVGVPTPVSGVVEEIYVQDGDTVKAGQDLFKIKPGAVSDKPAAAAAPEAPKPAPAAAAPPPPPPPTQAPSAASPPPPPPPRVSCCRICTRISKKRKKTAINNGFELIFIM